jgi:hypothetical protein
MASYIKLVQGDTKPDIVLSLNDRDTWEYIDLSDPATAVTMKFRKTGTTTILQTIYAIKLTGGLQADGTIDETVMTEGAGGRVMFSWPQGALDVDPGNYEGEVSITLADTTVQTLHDVLRFTVKAKF